MRTATDMKLLYLSGLSSERMIDDIHKRTGKNPGYAVQKFSRLLVKGLLDNGANVTALSNPPVTNHNCSTKFVRYGCIEDNGIQIQYIPFINAPIMKHLCVFCYTFFYIFFWGLKNRKDKAIVCDVLTVSACMGSLLASKINRVKSVGVVTDIYGFMVGGATSRSLLFSLACRLNKMYVSAFDKYVLLTEQMNAVVNPKRKPHIVMEALCDSQILTEAFTESEKVSPRTMLYAGGLNEKYGLKMLVEAFIEAKVDGELVLYGDGPYVKELKSVCETTDKVKYKGVASNEEVVAAEHRATILVNPRFTTEAFSPYSFPSKNMEYMTSGTPLLTTNLPGMPAEYREYVYLFGEETVEGYAKAIREIYSKSDDELAAKGAEARRFVLDRKNNIAQAERIVDFMKL